jgi:type I restriction enzyme S subunit
MTLAIENIKELKLNKSSWKLTKLGDLAEDISKRVDNPSTSIYDRFVGLEHFVSGDIKIKNWGSTENLASSAKSFQAGDILFARRNAYLRRASIAEFDGCCSGDAFVIRENHNKVIPGFLAFLMNSDALWDYANSNAAGTMSKRVKWRDLAEYEFLLPPKEEQAKIAELLWAIDEVIERNIFLLESLNSFYENASLKYLMGKERLIETRKERRNTRLGKLPSDWKVLKYKEVAELIHGYQFRDFDFTKDGIPIVKIGEIGKDGNLDLSDCSFIAEERLNEFKSKILSNGDILMALTGATLGKICRVSDLTNPVIQNYRVGRFEPNPELLDKSYLFHVLSNPISLNQIFGKIHQAAQGNVGKGDIEEVNIAVPTIGEQEKIGETLDLILDKKDYMIATIKSSQSLQKSLINQVF